jgi:TolA-binding protein
MTSLPGAKAPGIFVPGATVMNTEAKPKRTRADATEDISWITMQIEDLQYRIEVLQGDIEELEQKRDKIEKELGEFEDDESDEDEAA